MLHHEEDLRLYHIFSYNYGTPQTFAAWPPNKMILANICRQGSKSSVVNTYRPRSTITNNPCLLVACKISANMSNSSCQVGYVYALSTNNFSVKGGVHDGIAAVASLKHLDYAIIVVFFVFLHVSHQAVVRFR